MEFVILGSHTDYCEVICSDVKNLENVYFENEKFYLSKLQHFFYRLHFSHKLNSIIKLPFKEIWYSKYLNESKLENMKSPVFLFFDSNIHMLDKNYLRYLKQKFNGAIALLLMNPIQRISEYNPEYFNENFDFIFTTDQQDSENHGYNYIPGIYSKISDYDSTDIVTDQSLFFAGDNKNRVAFLHEIASYLKMKQCKYVFSITNVSLHDIRDDLNVMYNQRISYTDVLEHVLHTNCLLEIVQDGQSGVTLRTLEAIVYNKKLITNNLGLKKSKMYHPDYMRIFSEVSEIDIDFISRKTEVDYQYNDEYSLKRVFSKIESLIDKC